MRRFSRLGMVRGWGGDGGRNLILECRIRIRGFCWLPSRSFMFHWLGFVSFCGTFLAVGFAQGVESAVEIVAFDVGGGAEHSVDAGTVLVIGMADGV